MEKLTVYLIGILIVGLLIVAGYFFVYKPLLESEFKRGLAQCEKDTDTLYLPGKSSIEYRDTSLTSIKPVDVKETDWLLTLTTSFDTSFVSGKDTITSKSKVKIAVKKEEGIWNIENPIAEWISKFEHKDFMQAPDTVKIYTPKYIPTIEKENNWMLTGIAYVAGIISAIITFLLAK